MTTSTPDRFALLDADIHAAWQEVLTARGLWAHSPNADTVAAEQAAEDRMNRLLDLRYRTQTRTAA